MNIETKKHFKDFYNLILKVKNKKIIIVGNGGSAAIVVILVLI